VGPDYVACVLLFICSVVICPLHKLTLSEQAQVTLQLKVSISGSVKIFSQSKFPWVGGGGGGFAEKNFFPGPGRPLRGP